MSLPLCVFGPGGDFLRPWPAEDDLIEFEKRRDGTTTRDECDDARPTPAPNAASPGSPDNLDHKRSFA